MIQVVVKRKKDSVREVTVSGHAESAPKGEDLICAAVSVLVQTLYFSLEKLINVNCNANIHDGYFSVLLPLNMPEQERKNVGLLVDSMLIGMQEINRRYPGFLEVTEE